LHIFQIEGDEIIPVWHSQNVRSNGILVADFDGNLIEEFYFNDGTEIKGYTLPIKNRPNRPHSLFASALDSTRAHIQWLPVNGANYYQLYRGTSRSSLQLYEQILSNVYADSGLAVNQTYYYSVSAIDSLYEVIESMLSTIDSLKTGFPPKLISGNQINDRQVMLTFDKDIQFSDEKKFSAYLVRSNQFSTSALIMKYKKTILVGFSEKINLDVTDSLIVNNIFDLDGIPIDNSFKSIIIDISDDLPEPYLQAITILNRRAIELSFSEPMNAADLMQKDNYLLSPQGTVDEIEILDERNTIIRLTISKNASMGAIGRQTYLQLGNLHSESGVLLQETNKIYLNEEISDLSKVLVYPQPVKPGNSFVTFAKLPDKVIIHIFNMNGKLIRRLDEPSYFGGVQWDLKDINNQSIKSGIYIYTIDYNNDQKIGKLAIVR
ncbi:MAG TPA: T9SS type A sorting domain-containing protein, partial [Caldithrix sp.]|nr:T9SS type A sorting domain-containing protein [Caldithrix sp.]